MNILYITNMNTGNYAGPTYSIPAQIKAQSKIDNIFWYNVKTEENEEWKKLDFYNNLKNFPTGKIKNLPEPFNKPDLIIIEGFYSIVQNKIILEVLFGNIPYIIIPRGELTKKAQARKELKKKIVNLLLNNKFAKKALAIEYLTEQEQEDSGTKWNENFIVIPNGIDIPTKTKNDFSDKGLIFSFIGRIEPYQKGIDLLIKACISARDKLLKNNVKINFYGPDVDKKLKDLQEIIKVYNLEMILNFYPAVYGEDKRKILLKSDIFIMTSRFEGHSMALIEALSLGVPVFITKGTNMKKEVESFNAGWTCETTEESIKETLIDLLKNRENLLEKSKNAKELAKIYSWESIAKKSHDLYKELIAKRRK